MGMALRTRRCGEQAWLFRLFCGKTSRNYSVEGYAADTPAWLLFYQLYKSIGVLAYELSETVLGLADQ
jgi:hypothetical protein